MIKNSILLALYVGLFFNLVHSQQADIKQIKYTASNKGKVFVYWGGNRGSFSKSDITFKGENYNFTLNNVVSHDKPKGYHIDYINPARMTIPQTNFRLGYFFTDHYKVSIGVDHMKYVVTQNQQSNISGTINLGILGNRTEPLLNRTINYIKLGTIPSAKTPVSIKKEPITNSKLQRPFANEMYVEFKK